MRIAVIHDYFDKKGGGEKLSLILAKELNADLYTGFVEKEKTFDMNDIKNVNVLGKRIRFSLIRPFVLFYRFYKLDIKDKYDFFILSGNYSIACAKKCRPNLFYCHTPPRHLYSENQWFLSEKKMILRPFIRLYFSLLKYIDRKFVFMCDFIASNSENIKNRIKKYYGNKLYKKTKVVYPPIEIDKFKYLKPKDYYISWGRLHKLKRVDMIVQAFIKMPDKKLIVASCGPEYEKIKEMAYGFSNIEILGYVNDSQLKKLVGECLASIYIPIQEDFGMTPLEGMAAGKPCIGVNEAGLKETIIHKKTGYLCKPDISLDDICRAVKFMDKQRCFDMKEECINHALKFSDKNFIYGIKQIIDNNIKK